LLVLLSSVGSSSHSLCTPHAPGVVLLVLFGSAGSCQAPGINRCMLWLQLSVVLVFQLWQSCLLVGMAYQPRAAGCIMPPFGLSSWCNGRTPETIGKMLKKGFSTWLMKT
jgi:hypothetical protein